MGIGCRYALGALLYVSSAFGLQASQVGVIDWHKALVGVPALESLSTGPVFHGSAIYTATNNNILAAINSSDGSLLWRYLFDPEDRVLSFKKNGNVVAVLSGVVGGPSGANVRVLGADTGHLLVERRVEESTALPMSEPGSLWSDVAFSPEQGSKDVYVLCGGSTVQAMSYASGDIKWTWLSTEYASLVHYHTIIAEKDAVYVVGLASSFASYTLHVTALSPATGQVLTTTHISSSIADGGRGFITTKLPGQATRIVWAESSFIKSFALTPTLKSKVSSTTKEAAYDQVLQLSSPGHFVALKADGSSRVVSLDPDGARVKAVWEFIDSASSPAYGDSLFGGSSEDVSRVYWSQALQALSVETFSGATNGLKTRTLPFEMDTYGLINHVAIGDDAEILITTTTGAVQLWKDGKVAWTREESLASIILSEFVELPERKVASIRAGETESIVARLLRQAGDAQDFPTYLVSFIKRFATGSYASASSSAVVDLDGDETLSRDTFGFRQVIVAATGYGNVFGIDSSNGKILWSRILADDGKQVQPVKLLVTRTVTDGESPQVVLIAESRATSDLINTVLFHIEPLTGEDARGVSPSGKPLQGIKIVEGAIHEAYLLQTNLKTVVIVDEYSQVHLYPNTIAHADAFAAASSSLHIPLHIQSHLEGERRLTGHQVVSPSTPGAKSVLAPTWSLSLPVEETIQSIIPQARGPVASVGKVLGNRTTLYKYLNQHLFVVLTNGGLYLVDGAKGSIVYRADVKGDVKVSLVENWLVYQYWDADYAVVGSTKGWRVVSVELYEGSGVDEKTSSSDMSSFSAKSVDIHTVEQSFIYHQAITAITTTATKFGVSSKDIIVATADNKIQSISRRVLDPRRPDHKPTAEEQEEFLFQYDPVLPNDPRRVLSHNYEVAKTRRIVTSPSLLESTSLVFAYGDSDMFFTRVAPSNTFDVLSESFNKVQLVLTVCGLAAAIMVTKPMVERKRLRERWYQ